MACIFAELLLYTLNPVFSGPPIFGHIPQLATFEGPLPWISWQDYSFKSAVHSMDIMHHMHIQWCSQIWSFLRCYAQALEWLANGGMKQFISVLSLFRLSQQQNKDPCKRTDLAEKVTNCWFRYFASTCEKRRRNNYTKLSSPWYLDWDTTWSTLYKQTTPYMTRSVSTRWMKVDTRCGSTCLFIIIHGHENASKLWLLVNISKTASA